jgi:hypothetical protein
MAEEAVVMTALDVTIIGGGGWWNNSSCISSSRATTIIITLLSCVIAKPTFLAFCCSHGDVRKT